MPSDFNNAVAAGGKVETKQMSGGRYMHIVYGKDGKSYPSEIYTKKKLPSERQIRKEIKKGGLHAN